MSIIYEDVREKRHLSNRADDEYFGRVLISNTDDDEDEGLLIIFETCFYDHMSFS